MARSGAQPVALAAACLLLLLLLLPLPAEADLGNRVVCYFASWAQVSRLLLLPTWHAAQGGACVGSSTHASPVACRAPPPRARPCDAAAP